MFVSNSNTSWYGYQNLFSFQKVRCFYLFFVINSRAMKLGIRLTELEIRLNLLLITYLILNFGYLILIICLLSIVDKRMTILNYYHY